MTRKIRLCVITSFPPVMGGEATYAQDFVTAMENYLGEELDSIYVLTHTEGKGSKSHERKGKIHVFRIFDSLSLRDKNIAFLKLLAKIRTIRPDVVHLEYSTIPNGRYGGMLGESLFILFFLLRLTHIPLFITQHSLWLPEQAQERIYEKTKSKILSSLGVLYLKIFTHLFAKMPNRLFLLVNLRNSELTRIFSKEFNIPRCKIREEVHGVWVDVDTLSQPQESKKIVCLGVINPSKGYEYTIRAMKQVVGKFPMASLVIAGAPPPTNYEEGSMYIEKLNYIIQENDLSHSVTIEDKYLLDEEFVKYVKDASVVVLPYSKVVGASGIMHMAMRYKVPVVVAGSGLFFQELSKFVPVVPPNDPVELAAKIIRILDDQDYGAMIRENYAKYLRDHDWRLVTKNIYATYREDISA
jgi:glycosyltransferase involved in cell wall biosynthesis